MIFETYHHHHYLTTHNLPNHCQPIVYQLSITGWQDGRSVFKIFHIVLNNKLKSFDKGPMNQLWINESLTSLSVSVCVHCQAQVWVKSHWKLFFSLDNAFGKNLCILFIWLCKYLDAFNFFALHFYYCYFVHIKAK